MAEAFQGIFAYSYVDTLALTSLQLEISWEDDVTRLLLGNVYNILKIVWFIKSILHWKF